eukprot:4083292-Prymnesium_polylepis.1
MLSNPGAWAVAGRCACSPSSPEPWQKETDDAPLRQLGRQRRRHFGRVDAPLLQQTAPQPLLR